jgi:hypothetical protein
MWSKLHYFARVFNPTKSLFFDTIMAVLADLRWFLMFLGLTLMGFALAFYCLFRFDREQTTVGESFAGVGAWVAVEAGLPAGGCWGGWCSVCRLSCGCAVRADKWHVHCL